MKKSSVSQGQPASELISEEIATLGDWRQEADLFDSSLDGNARRAIDIHEGEVVDAPAFKALIRRAVAFNSAA